MDLTDEEQAMLDGEMGEGTQIAMELVVALAKTFEAEELVKVESVQVSGVSYKNIGDAGLEWLRELADGGAKVRTRATLNPAGSDLQDWDSIGFPESFHGKQKRVVDAFAEMGIETTCTCTPYEIGYVPMMGDHCAWGESSAVSYINSLVGARTNREGGPAALAAALTGRTGRYGMHLDENRQATHLVEVETDIEDYTDWSVLGHMIGSEVHDGVPYVVPPEGADPATTDLKSLGAGMAASGAVPLHHTEGHTAEVLNQGRDLLRGDHETLVVEDLTPGYERLNSDAEEIDLVTVGCPHLSLDEVLEVAEALEGHEVSSEFWIHTSRSIKEQVAEMGMLEPIERSGARIVADTCMVVAPLTDLGFHTMATNSAKAGHYGPTHCDQDVRVGDLETCIRAAVSGRWPEDA